MNTTKNNDERVSILTQQWWNSLSNVLEPTQWKLLAAIWWESFNPLSEYFPYKDEFNEIIKKLNNSPIKDKLIVYLYTKFIKYKNWHWVKNIKYFRKVKDIIFDLNEKFENIKHPIVKEIISSYIYAGKGISFIENEFETAIKLNDFSDISDYSSRLKEWNITILECYNLIDSYQK